MTDLRALHMAPLPERQRAEHLRNEETLRWALEQLGVTDPGSDAA